MTRLTELAHAALRVVLKPGEAAIDGTAGNGHDSELLSTLVGPSGRVFAFDVQPEALARTRERLGGSENVTFILRDHAEIREAIPIEYHGRIGAIAFNLGYLPGGDKSVVTRPDSTVRAIAEGLELLRAGGVLTVLAYPGHPGGNEEARCVEWLLAELSTDAFEVRKTRSERDSDLAPRLFVVRKRVAVG